MATDDAPNPEGLFASRPDRLFRTVHPRDRGPYTPAEVAAINAAAGDNAISATYMWQLETGRRDNPTYKHGATPKIAPQGPRRTLAGCCRHRRCLPRCVPCGDRVQASCRPVSQLWVPTRTEFREVSACDFACLCGGGRAPACVHRRQPILLVTRCQDQIIGHNGALPRCWRCP